MSELTDFRYCFLRTNTRLKEVIKARIKHRQQSLRTVCEKADLDYSRLYTYLNKSYYDRTLTRYASQKEVLALAAYLGIDIDIRVQIRGKDVK
jgi:lambda repressor-like predicted transcriptional regulator